MEMEFRLKKITFFHREIVIICQNENGPCPLLAIANVLLLKGAVSVSTDRSYLSLEEVQQLLVEALIEESARGTAGEYERHQQVEDALQVLPKMAQGLDLNVHFSAVNKHEFTQEIAVFDALGIPLLHGWLCDEREAVAIGEKSYNVLLNDLVRFHTLRDRLAAAQQHCESETHTYTHTHSHAHTCEESTEGAVSSSSTAPVNENAAPTSTIAVTTATVAEDVPAPAEHGHIDNSAPADTVPLDENSSGVDTRKEECTPANDTNCSPHNIPSQTADHSVPFVLTEEESNLLLVGPVLDEFLTHTASQLTEKGIVRLYEFMHDRQLAVFFRNNHFSTLFSYNGQLFLLLTDLGFADQPAVWELLVSVDGKTEFFNDLFIPIDETLQDSLSSDHANDLFAAQSIFPVEGTVCLPPAPQSPVIASAAQPVIITSSASPLPSESQHVDEELAATSPMHPLVATHVPSPSVETEAPPTATPDKSLKTRTTSAKAPSAYDHEERDRQLALQLQMEMDREASQSHSSPSSPAAMSSQGIDLDQQLALELHYREMHAASREQQSRGNPPSSSSTNNRNSSRRQNKQSPACVVQ